MAWKPIKRREYLFMKAIGEGAGIFDAAEAVASTLMAHPEWDRDEMKTWPEWETEATTPPKQGRCPTCGPTTTERHPSQPGVARCTNCKEWLHIKLPEDPK